MKQALQSVQTIAQNLLEIERLAFAESTSDIKLAIEVCAKLQVPLTKFAGPVGYSSLLSRALNLASVKGHKLKNLRVDSEGSLKLRDVVNIGPPGEQTDPPINEGVLLVAHLLALLEIFIGEQLMFTLLYDAWPDETFEKAALAREDKP